MDPNANLAELRRCVANILAAEDASEDNDRTAAEIYGDAVRLAELAGAMHAWLACGGALPQAWQGGR